MSSEPHDSQSPSREVIERGPYSKWTVRVDIFDVRLTYERVGLNAHVVEQSCNCDSFDTDCRHVRDADRRVRSVFSKGEGAGSGTIVAAPALWKPQVDNPDVVASDVQNPRLSR